MPRTDLSSNDLTHVSNPMRRRQRWRSFAAPAFVAALGLLVPSTVLAQDIGPGKSKPAKKAPAKKAPAKKAAKPVAKKAPAKKAPAKNAAPAQAPAKKPAKPARPASAAGEAPQAPVVPAVPAAPGKLAAPGAKKSLDGAHSAGAKPAAPAIKSLSEGFEKLLAPHGTWVEDEGYGKLWFPDEKEVGKRFAPYRTDGRWAATDDGSWSWVSDYDWGNVPFHYGRWLWTKDKKWAWSPGETYAPAWVIWRVGDAGYDFVGWAPMAPEPKPVKKADATTPKGADAKQAASPAKKSVATNDAAAKTNEAKVEEKARHAKVLPFYFVKNKHLFLQGVEKYVLTDRKLGLAVQQHSDIYQGNLIKGRKGFFKPATPTFSEIRVPAFAIPRSRLSALAEEVAPLTLDALRGLVSTQKPVKKPEEVKAVEAKPEASAKAEPEKKRRFATPPPAEKAKGETRYRCWWTNSRPRIWRCGY